jgi:arylsulfatase A-like enzyme/Flp pilus assembly protein TadD
MRAAPGGRRTLAAFGLTVAAAAAALLLLRTRAPEGPRPSKAARGGPLDILLVTIDTLRADAVGFGGNREVGTPHLDRLALEGLVFDRAHASNVVTLPSHTNILTGLYPHQHGVRDNSGFRLDPRFPTLATILKERGYTTGAFVGAFPLDSRFGLDRGFDVYDDRYPPGSSAYDFEMRERPATEVVPAARAWWESARGKKRFLWVHLYDPHAPYRPPPPFAQQYAGRPYLGEIASTDDALAPLLDLLRSEEAGRALVVVTGDHGEALGDHGELTHGLFAYQATLRVPLLLWCPGRITPGRTKRSARHVDILPTVLSLAGMPPPSGLPGHSLLSSSPDEPAYFESLSTSLNRGWAPLTGVLEGPFKYIDLPIPELYDLESDPAEKENLFGKRRDVARGLKKRLPVEGPAARQSPVAGEEARRLLALGYLSGQASPRTSYSEEDDPKRLVGLDVKIHRVVDLYQSGDVSGALALSREILRERPTMSAGYEFLAFLLQHTGRDLEAARILREALRRGLGSEATRVRLALILSESGQPAEALEALRPVSGSDDPDTQNAVGIALSDAGRTEEALRAFARVLSRDPSNAIALQNSGIALLKRGDAAGALLRLDRALGIEDNLPRTWNAKGVAQSELGDTAAAIASWRRAAELDPRQYDALFNIGIVAGRRGEIGTARDALRRFLATAPPALYGRDLEQARRLLAQMGGA